MWSISSAGSSIGENTEALRETARIDTGSDEDGPGGPSIVNISRRPENSK